jgi:hypothetical protein
MNYRDPSGSGGGDIDVVHPGAEAADNFQPMGRLNDLGINIIASQTDQSIDLPHFFHQHFAGRVTLFSPYLRLMDLSDPLKLFGKPIPADKYLSHFYLSAGESLIPPKVLELRDFKN